MKYHEWGGLGSYKEAYGPAPLRTWRLLKGKSRLLVWGRNIALAGYYRQRQLKAYWQRNPGEDGGDP
jgi:hypothetical protein